jgi:hypothetical protein
MEENVEQWRGLLKGWRGVGTQGGLELGCFHDGRN